MRMVHMDMVEEAYWKRLMASRLARECATVALKKARAKAIRQREEAAQ